jgi:hypothetical protein
MLARPLARRLNYIASRPPEFPDQVCDSDHLIDGGDRQENGTSVSSGRRQRGFRVSDHGSVDDIGEARRLRQRNASV